jgi:hypothetical protein
MSRPPMWNETINKVQDNYNNYDDQEHQNLFHYRIEKISNIFAITCMVLAFVYILFAVIYTSCGGMSNDADAYYDHTSGGGLNARQWANYELSTSNGGGGQRRRQQQSRRRQMHNSMDKEEPLVGGGMMPQGGITDNEGFITDMVSSSSGSSMGSHPWERGKQFAGQLS